MKAFEYAQARSEAEVLELLAPEAGECEVLAGGTDLVGLMKKMVVTPQRVVNIMEVGSLRGIEPSGDGGVRIGAAVTLDQLLEHPYLENYAAVLHAVRGINSMQLQAQGTLVGELCQRPQCWYFRNGHGLLGGAKAATGGDNRYHAIFGNTGPAKFACSSRIAPALIALGAKLRILGPATEEEQLLPVADFYRTPRTAGQRETILQPGQFVSHVLLPPPDGQTTSATYEVRHGAGPDYPLISAAAVLQWQGGAVRDAKIVLGLAAPTPYVSSDAAAELRGRRVDQNVAESAGQAAVARATPLSDNHYKVHLAKVAVKRAVLLAAGLETGGF